MTARVMSRFDANFIGFARSLFVLVTLAFMAETTSFAGSIFFRADFMVGKLNLWVDNKPVYSGLQTLDQLRLGETWEWPVIWIQDVPSGSYSFRIRFQDLTPSNESISGSASQLSFNFNGCSAASIPTPNGDHYLVSFTGPAFGEMAVGTIIDQTVGVIVGPQESRIYCRPENTPEFGLAQIRAMAEALSSEIPITVRVFKYLWSELKAEIKKVIRLTSAIRTAIVASLRSMTDPGTKIRYSQDERLGPSSFDCSGLVYYQYQTAGIDSKNMTVAELAASDKFREISLEQAKAGDLIVHLKADDHTTTSNHIGIYTGTDDAGNPLEISATTRKGFAELPPDDPDFKSSVIELKAKLFGNKWRFYQWADSE
ncbi:NlpC/P60 family protein [Bdellovibrionota bacterium FG-2]